MRGGQSLGHGFDLADIKNTLLKEFVETKDFVKRREFIGATENFVVFQCHHVRSALSFVKCWNVNA